MNISGIRTYAGFYDYNTIKIKEARSQQIQEAKTADPLLMAEVSATETENSQGAVAVASQGPDQGAMEFAKQYQPEAVYDLKGPESDILNLDVEKALSDMKKDQVLQQYQFFIGESTAQESERLDTSRMNENFTL